MKPFSAIDTEKVNSELQQQFQQVQATFGGIPNLMKMFANAPDTMTAFTQFYANLTQGSFSQKDIEQIAIPVSASNSCEYCVAVHFFIGAHLGVERAELVRNLEGTSSDKKMTVLLQFAKELVEKKGPVSNSIQKKLAEHKVDHAQQIEILCIVYAFSLLNRLKHLTQPELDFPPVAEFNRPIL